MSFLRDLLAPFTVSHLLSKDSSIVRVNKNDLAVDALKVLTNHKLLSAPVWDEEANAYLGFLDILDIVALVFSAERAALNDFREEDDWEQFFRNTSHIIVTKTVGETLYKSRRNLWKEISESAPLYDLVQLMSNEENHHRVAVLAADRPEVIGIVSQSRVIEFFHKEINTPALKDLNVISSEWYKALTEDRELKTVNSKLDAYSGFRLLQSEQVSGLPVVNDEGELVGTISASDIKSSIGSRLFQDMMLQLPAYLVTARGDFCLDPIIVNERDTLGSILEKLFSFHIHRVFVVDHENHPTCVLSLCDIISFLLSF